MKYIICLIIIAAPASLWAGWESEAIASEGNVGGGCSLAADRWGRLHISYVDETEGEVKYARYDGSSWEFETIASDVEVRGLTAIDLDAFDRPHVVFSDEKAGALTYAYRSGTSWVTEKITDGTDNLYVSIYAWGSGPHVSYAKLGVMTSLRYAYRDGGEWFTEAVASGGGEFNKLVLDNDQTPHIIFHGSGKIKHAFREEAAWTINDIAEGIYCDGIVGPDSKLHVSFASTDNDALMYAVSDTGESWEVEEIPAAQGKPTVTRITLNSGGGVFISYYSVDEFDVHLAKKTGVSWTREAVTNDGDAGNPHSLVLDGNGYPVIAYYESVGADLMLTRYDPLTGVELTSFTARRAPEGVDVRWAVGRAEGVAGYNLYREATGAGRLKVNDDLINGSSPFLYCDKAARAGVAYNYWLEAVTTTGKARTFGPATVPPAAKPGGFALHQNVPNPVSRATTFSFELAEGSGVKLAVYDAAGRKVADVADGYYGPGQHDVPFTSELAPGVYVYRLDAGSRTAARKMVVVK
jgi:hypothetical protein